MEPLDHIKRNRNLNTKLLVTIPLDQRIGLAEMSKATETSQQELIRRAIGAMLADFAVVGKDHRATKSKTSAKAQTPITPGISVDREPLQVNDTRPPQPSPDHVWVTRGTGGYWRAKAGNKK
jgi:transposase InsO family protein